MRVPDAVRGKLTFTAARQCGKKPRASFTMPQFYLIQRNARVKGKKDGVKIV